MSCPYFWPLAPDPNRHVARAPLGAMHTGTCTLGPALADLELCNFGYARGRCAAFPQDSAADAVRFDGSRYILERNYIPIEFGEVQSATAAIERQFTALTEWLKPLR